MNNSCNKKFIFDPYIYIEREATIVVLLDWKKLMDKNLYGLIKVKF